MDVLYIVMPAYNEAENIENVVRAWYQKLGDKNEKSRLVVADSGSSDGTSEILAKLRQELPKLCILGDTLKEHGPKLLALYKYAVVNGADYIFQTDSDGQTAPEEFDKFWQKRNDYDAILGERLNRGDGKERAFVEKIVCWLLKVIFNVKVPDANAPFRLMKTQIVDKYMGRFKEDYNIPNIMFTAFWSYYGENICFEPISFRPRMAGKNSINLKKIFKIGIRAIGDFHDFKRNMC